MQIDDVLTRLGGSEPASRLTGVGLEAIRKWRQARAIPSKHWSAIVAATGLSFADLQPAQPSTPMPQHDTAPPGATAALVLADGAVFWGRGFGAHSDGRVGELCFNTGMTGYQETLTDASYAGQIITFTFPHIGNVGANAGDMEATNPAALGLVVKQDVTEPSNWRATQHLDAWLRAQGLPGIAGVDTRALTLRIRDGGPPTGVLAFPADGTFDLAALRPRRRPGPAWRAWTSPSRSPAPRATSGTKAPGRSSTASRPQEAPRHHVVAVDYGAKRNILRSLAQAGCRVTVVPADSTAEDILRHRPDGVFLSNGPGDPAATGAYAVPAIQGVLDAEIPVFGICLGHQLLALALGARTYKLDRGPPRRQPAGEGPGHRAGRDHQPEPRLRGGRRQPAGGRARHPRPPVRRQQRGHRLRRPPRLQRAIPPRGQPRPSDSAHLFRRFTAMMDRSRAFLKV